MNVVSIADCSPLEEDWASHSIVSSFFSSESNDNDLDDEVHPQNTSRLSKLLGISMSSPVKENRYHAGTELRKNYNSNGISNIADIFSQFELDANKESTTIDAVSNSHIRSLASSSRVEVDSLFSSVQKPSNRIHEFAEVIPLSAIEVPKDDVFSRLGFDVNSIDNNENNDIISDVVSASNNLMSKVHLGSPFAYYDSVDGCSPSSQNKNEQRLAESPFPSFASQKAIGSRSASKTAKGGHQIVSASSKLHLMKLQNKSISKEKTQISPFEAMSDRESSLATKGIVTANIPVMNMQVLPFQLQLQPSLSESQPQIQKSLSQSLSQPTPSSPSQPLRINLNDLFNRSK